VLRLSRRLVAAWGLDVANKISRAKVDEMWAAYQDRQSVDHVAKKCGVHWKTVERYRRLEKWDQRLAEIRRQAQEDADVDLAKAAAESLRLVRSYKDKLAAALEFKNIPDEDVTAAELEKIVKLEAFLLGGVESRQEVVGAFAAWTDEELKAYAENGTAPDRSRRRSA
jgi:protein subunit release factor A